MRFSAPVAKSRSFGIRFSMRSCARPRTAERKIKQKPYVSSASLRNRGGGGEADQDRYRCARCIADERCPESERFSQKTAEERTQREADVVHAVKSAQYATTLIGPGKVDAGDFACNHPDAFSHAHEKNEDENQPEPGNS